MGANWIVREAVETDETAVRCIYNTCQAQGTWAEGNQKYTEKSIHSFFCRHKEQGEPLLVAQADGHVAGFALLWEFREWKTEEKTMEYAVYTDPDWRRQGVASLLLEAVKEQAEEWGAVALMALIYGICLRSGFTKTEVSPLRGASPNGKRTGVRLQWPFMNWN